MSVLGIDLGATKLAIARYSHDLRTIEAEKIQKTPMSYQDVEHALIDMIHEMKTADTKAIGIGVPGLVERDTGRIRMLPNISGSSNQDLAGFLKSATGVSVAIANDAALFTLAEAVYGAGKGERIVIGVTLGTGVGGGIVIDGKIFSGAHGFAGEIGHMLLRPGEPPFNTDDKRGDVEQFLSGTALGKRCEAASDPSHYLQGETCGFLHPDVFREIAWLIVNLAHAFDPSMIVFGGSAGRALTQHLISITKELDRWMLPGSHAPKLAISTLQDAGTRGAAMLAAQNF